MHINNAFSTLFICDTLKYQAQYMHHVNVLRDPPLNYTRLPHGPIQRCPRLKKWGGLLKLSPYLTICRPFHLT